MEGSKMTDTQTPAPVLSAEKRLEQRIIDALRTARNEALEDAAKLSDAREARAMVVVRDEENRGEIEESMEWRLLAARYRQLAKSIRALREPTP
jgi:acyl-CoA synthetase (AMP-forming)/AMP-acid ligase II